MNSPFSIPASQGLKYGSLAQLKLVLRNSEVGFDTGAGGLVYKSPLNKQLIPLPDPGVDGVDGNKWFTGAGAPAVGGSEIDGDLYLDTVTADIYRFQSGSWTGPISNIMGADGADGVRGSKWFTGTGDPNVIAPSGSPIVQDMYQDTSSGNTWEKITEPNTWLFTANIRGPQGAPGAAGDGVYTIVTNESEFQAAVQNAAVLNIMAVNDIGFFGGFGYTILSSKRIFAVDNAKLSLGEVSIWDFQFPASGGTDIFIDFFTNIECISTSEIRTSGGFVGAHTHAVRFVGLTDTPTVNPGPEITVQYEKSDIDLSATPDVDFGLWSGNFTQGKLDINTTITPTEKHIIAENFTYLLNGHYIEDEVIGAGGTDGQELHMRKYIRSLSERGRIGFRTDNADDSTSGNESHILSVRRLGILEIALAVNTWGHVSVADLADPWYWDCTSLAYGKHGALYDFIDSDDGAFLSGEVQHAYLADNFGGVQTWRFRTGNIFAFRSEYENGIQSKWVSTTADAIDDLISWTPAVRESPLEFNYKFDIAITTPPPSARIRLNNAAYASATEVYLSDTDLNYINNQTQFECLTGGTAGTLILSNKARTTMICYKITATNPLSGYTTFTVTYVNKVGGFADLEELILTLEP